MKVRNLAVAALMATVGVGAFAQAQEQFFPGLPYRTGAYAPNGVPWANGYADYLKLTNARGGINGVKVSFEECETGYATDRGVECYERLKGKNGGATVFQPLCRFGDGLDVALDLVELSEQLQRRAGDAALVGNVQFDDQVEVKKNMKCETPQLDSLLSDFKSVLNEIFQKLKTFDFTASPADKDICTSCDWRRLCRAPHLN